jgi:hypothetical protein
VLHCETPRDVSFTVKGVFAEAPSCALSQGEAKKIWQKEANAQLAGPLSAKIQRQLISEGLPYSLSSHNGD